MDALEFQLKFNLFKGAAFEQDPPCQLLAGMYKSSPEQIAGILSRQRELVIKAARELHYDRAISEMIRGKSLIFLGDSVTSDREGYVEILREALSSLSAQVINSGFSGNRTTDVLGNLQNRVFQHRPDQVWILLGINDRQTVNLSGKPRSIVSLTEYLNNLYDICFAIKAKSIPVIIISPPPSCREKCLPELHRNGRCWDDTIIFQFREELPAFCQKHDIPFLDVSPRFDGYSPDLITIDDGIHLNYLGHHLLAEACLSFLPKNFSFLKSKKYV